MERQRRSETSFLVCGYKFFYLNGSDEAISNFKVGKIEVIHFDLLFEKETELRIEIIFEDLQFGEMVVETEDLYTKNILKKLGAIGAVFLHKNKKLISDLFSSYICEQLQKEVPCLKLYSSGWNFSGERVEYLIGSGKKGDKTFYPHFINRKDLQKSVECFKNWINSFIGKEEATLFFLIKHFAFLYSPLARTVGRYMLPVFIEFQSSSNFYFCKQFFTMFADDAGMISLNSKKKDSVDFLMKGKDEVNFFMIGEEITQGYCFEKIKRRLLDLSEFSMGIKEFEIKNLDVPKSPQGVNLVFARRSPCHTLRHTYATRCFEKNIPSKVIQRLLGHSSLEMTTDLYTHVSKEKMLEEVADLKILG